MTKRETNEEFVVRLMSFSARGGLMQIFIMCALWEYSKNVAETPEIKGNDFIDGSTWKALAQEVQYEMKKKGYK